MRFNQAGHQCRAISVENYGISDVRRLLLSPDFLDVISLDENLSPKRLAASAIKDVYISE